MRHILIGGSRFVGRYLTASLLGSQVRLRRRADVWAVVLVLIVYTGVCIAFISRPFSWGDEVQFTDPAANLYFHGRFVTTAWPYQTVDDVFFGNAPLYSLLLACWYELVGFSLFKTRILSWIFACVGIAYSLAALQRSSLLVGNYRLILTSLFLTGAGLSVSIWSARYDTLGFVVLAALLYGLAVKGTRSGDITRRVALMLAPVAGFHLVFVVLFLYAAISWAGRRSWRASLPDIAFMIGGGLAMLAFYGVTVGIGRFVFLTLFSDHTVLGQAARGASRGFAHALVEKGTALLGVFTQDPSYTVLLIGTAVAAIWILYRNQWRMCFARRDIALAAGAALLPILLLLIGKYAVYYSWIGWSCLCVLFLMVLSRPEIPSNWRTAMIAGSIAVSLGVGLASYLESSLAPAPTDAYRAELDAAIDRDVRPGEVVFSDMATYFDVWRRAGHVYVHTYAQNYFLPGFPMPSPVTAMVVREENLVQIEKLLDGTWQCVWRSSTTQRGDLPELRLCKRR